MFDFIRSHQRLMQLLLLILIVPSFVFFGVQGYERMNQNTQSVAKVGGQPITQAELDNAQREQVARMRQTYGPSIDAAMFDTPEARSQTLDGLIAQHVLTWQASRESLGTSDRRLQEAILAIPQLQDGGKFDQNRYEALLAQQGMTPVVFEQRMRQDLAIQQIDAAIEGSVIVPKRVVDRFAAIVAQRREVRPLQFKAADYAGKVQLAPDAVRKDYDAHPDAYMTPESARVEYAVLSADAIAKQTTVSAKDEHDFYESNKTRYEVPEQRRASHILVAVAKDASAADKDKAKAKADALLKQLRAASPSNVAAEFAKLAKQDSDDPGSAANGGDLDFMGRGATVPPFEAALFKLKENEISDVVQSDFGYHIIELTGLKPAQVKPFETVKGEIDAELAKQMAQKKFQDEAVAFSNGVYEQGDALAPTAQKFGLTVMTADNVTRAPAADADPTSPLANAKLLTALFSADSLKNRHNTEAVETSPGTLVAARVLDYKPATRKPLDQVADGIRTRLVAVEARKAADAAGQAALAKLKTGGDAARDFAFGKATTVSRVDRSDTPAEAVTEIFRTDATKLPAYAGLSLPSGDFAVYAIDGVTSIADADPARRASLAQSIAKQVGSIEFGAYLARSSQACQGPGFRALCRSDRQEGRDAGQGRGLTDGSHASSGPPSRARQRTDRCMGRRVLTPAGAMRKLPARHQPPEHRMFKRILLAYDGSESGRQALLECGEVASLMRSDIKLLAVTPSMPPVYVGEGFIPTETLDAEKEHFREVLDEGIGPARGARRGLPGPDRFRRARRRDRPGRARMVGRSHRHRASSRGELGRALVARRAEQVAGRDRAVQRARGRHRRDLARDLNQPAFRRPVRAAPAAPATPPPASRCRA